MPFSAVQGVIDFVIVGLQGDGAVYFLRLPAVIQLDARDLGHGLKALHARVCELGLSYLYQMTAENSEVLELLVTVNEFHQLRSIQTGFKTFAICSLAEHFSVRLQQAVAAKVGYEPLTVAFPAKA